MNIIVNQPYWGKPMIRVVTAAITSTHVRRVMLLTQRSRFSPFPFAWCTPGGKVKDRESDLEALFRELNEEIGLSQRWLQSLTWGQLYDIRMKDPDVRVVCFTAHVERFPEIHTPNTSHEVIGIGWFDAQNIDHLELTPADHYCRTELLEAVGAQR